MFVLVRYRGEDIMAAIITAVEGPFQTWDDAARYGLRSDGSLWTVHEVREPEQD